MNPITATSDKISISPIEAAWNASAAQLADWVLDYLIVRNDAWGAINPLSIRETINPKTNKPYGKTCTVTPDSGRGTLGKGTLIRHFRATDPEHVIGLLAIGTDDTCSGIALDIDAHKLDEGRPEVAERNMRFVLHVRDELEQYGIGCLIIDSNAKGGYHLRVLFRERITSDLAYRFGQWLLRDWQEFGFCEQPESFPKATSHKTKRGGICGGGWIRLFGRHHTRETWSTVFNGVEFVSGQAAIDTILATTGSDPDLIPQAAREYKTPREIKEDENRIRAEAAHREFESREKPLIAGTVNPYDVARRMCDKSPGWVDRPTGQSGRENACFSLMCWIVRGTGLSSDEVVSVVDANWNHKACTMDGDLIPFTLPELQKKAVDATSAVMSSGGPTLNDLRSAEEWSQKQTQRRVVIDARTPSHMTENISVACTPGIDAAAQLNLAFAGYGTDLKNWLDNSENWTDIGNARLFGEMFGDNVRYCHKWQKWLVWDGTRWEVDERGRVQQLAMEVADKLWEIARQMPPDKLTFAVKYAAKSSSCRAVAAILELSRSELGIAVTPQELDSDIWLLNCLNGTVDLRTGDLNSHDRRNLITRLCPVEYDPNAICPLWEESLLSIFGGVLELSLCLQTYFGHCLTGDVREQILMILYGDGANGKSTILNVFMSILGPEYTMKAVPDLLLSKKHESHSTERADLYRKRFVACVETAENRVFDEVLVKELTGGDKIRARRMREDNWEFDPTHKPLVCTNHKPRVRGDDHGIWRRLVLVPFTQRFWNPTKGESGPEHLRQDSTLTSRLMVEASGILRWCVLGCLEWQENGLFIPAEIRTATDTYRVEEDSFAQFINECCVIGPEYRVSSADLIREYKAWAKSSGEALLSSKAIGQRLKKRGFERGRSNGIKYSGIGLVQSSEVIFEKDT